MEILGVGWVGGRSKAKVPSIGEFWIFSRTNLFGLFYPLFFPLVSFSLDSRHWRGLRGLERMEKGRGLGRENKGPSFFSFSRFPTSPSPPPLLHSPHRLSFFLLSLQGRNMGSPPPPPVFCPQKSKHAGMKVENKNSSPQSIETMMCLQLGETFSGFMIQRAVKWVLQTQNSLLLKYNEPPKIFVPPSF